MKDEDYQAILGRFDESLRILGEQPPDQGNALRILGDLRMLRETLIRAQRDAIDKNIRRPDSAAPLGVP